MQTLKGTWLSANEFVTEDGEIITIYAYRDTLDKYKPKFPLACYVLLDREFVLNVVEID